MLHVVVLEDLRWADEATIDLLRFIGRRIRLAPLLLIATYRDDSMTSGDPLLMALGDLATQRSTRRLGVGPLSVSAVAALAGDSGLDSAALFELTGGNPFYVTEIVRTGMDKVPPSARDAVLARAARLGIRSRELLEAAALIGARIELRLLDSVITDAPPLIDEVLASGLLVGDGAGLKFRHEIVRMVVAQAIATHRGGSIHARILEALDQLGCDDERPVDISCGGGWGRPGGHALCASRRVSGGRTRLASGGRSAVSTRPSLRG